LKAHPGVTALFNRHIIRIRRAINMAKTAKSRKKNAAAKGGKKGGKGRKPAAARKKRGKLTPAGRKRIANASRARWRDRKGAGRPGKGNHIPLKVLEKNHANLGRIIEVRKKSSADWT
jgi:hypothetical protein